MRQALTLIGRHVAAPRCECCECCETQCDENQPRSRYAGEVDQQENVGEHSPVRAPRAMAFRPQAATFAVVIVTGCAVAEGDPAFWTPSHELGGAGVAGAGGQPAGGGGEGGGSLGGSAGSGGSAAAAGSPGGGGAAQGGSSGGGGSGGGTSSGPCAMHVEFTTLTYHGKYSPKNIGAVWVTTASGEFVKSLRVWAGKRIVNLVKWNAASKGNKVDAITAATSTSHGARFADWDCTDLGHQPVADGQYRLMLEITEEDSSKLIWPPGPSMGIDFVTGSGPVSVTPPNQTNYVSIKLTLN